MGAILKIQLLAFFLAIQSDCYFQYNFDSVADSGNYTCDEMTRWLGSEKHYSNDKKDVLFGLLANQDCQKNPVVFLTDVSFGYSANGKKLFFQPKLSARKQDSCKFKDRLAVVYLSNFSINRNFSHFLHGLLRLFCALIDARWIVWDNTLNRFRKKENYTLWLDEYFQLTPSKKIWLGALSENIRHMGKELAKGTCVSSDRMLYGSGCVKLLPPEKWFGYPGCRAGQVLPAFGQYMRQVGFYLSCSFYFFFESSSSSVDVIISPLCYKEEYLITVLMLRVCACFFLQMFNAASAADLFVTDSRARGSAPGVKVAFAVRAVGDLTGRREISNLGHVQALLRKTQHVNTVTENVTFEHFDVPATVQYMAKVNMCCGWFRVNHCDFIGIIASYFNSSIMCWSLQRLFIDTSKRN